LRIRESDIVDEIVYRPIGIIRSPIKQPRGAPIQPTAAAGIEAVVEVFPEYAEGLEDIEGFSHIILLCHFHLAMRAKLKVKPFMDDKLHGVFATRAPARPNPIGLSIVRLVRVEGRKLLIRDVDIVDGTPLLDVKPYVPEFDIREAGRTGWRETTVGKLPEVKDDGRFAFGSEHKQ